MTLLESVLWLTMNVYHEARGENLKGQMAVVYVTLNRSKKRNKTVKEVILEPYQFSWTLRDKETWMPKDTKTFMKCMASVYKALDSEDFTGGATFYHNQTVKPKWRHSFKYVGMYGTHSFYKPYN